MRQVLGVLVLHGDVVLEEDDEDAEVRQNFQNTKSLFAKLQREISLVGDEFCLHSGHMPLLVEGDLTSFLQTTVYSRYRMTT